MGSFASDNDSGVHPLVMKVLNWANIDHSLGYGDDKWTEGAVTEIKETFMLSCVPLFASNGTGSSVVALQLITRPCHSIFCAGTAHTYVDEYDSPMKMIDCQARPIATPDGRLTPELMQSYLCGFGDQHHSRPRALYISQCTGLGTIYTPEELKRLTDLAHLNGMYVHVDGAGTADTCAVSNLSLEELTVDCRVDILSFGGTENGLMMGEYVVVFNKDLQPEACFTRKQSAQLASKMRHPSYQFTAYLTGNLWLKDANRANAMAAKLYTELKKLPEVTFVQGAESNQLFLTIPRPVIDRMLESYFLYFWDEEKSEICLVTSFDITEKDVDEFIKLSKR